jgi:hypothetical protein
MTTFNPPPPYTADELKRLYPSLLELRQVQIIFRHGALQLLQAQSTAFLTLEIQVNELP